MSVSSHAKFARDVEAMRHRNDSLRILYAALAAPYIAVLSCVEGLARGYEARATSLDRVRMCVFRRMLLPSVLL